MRYSVAEIAHLTQGKLICYGDINGSFLIEQVLYDSRIIVSPNSSIFIALKGVSRDGHSYIKYLYDQGVHCFLVEEGFDSSEYLSGCFIEVKNPLKALQAWAEAHRKQFSIPIIGITGSNGKTVVKEWLFQLLCSDFHIYRSPRSFNSQLGVAISLLGITSEHSLAIIEAGISQPGEMETLWQMIQPNVTVITQIGSAHDAAFQSRELKAIEKSVLIQGADVVVYPKDIEVLRKVMSENQTRFPLTKNITWGHEKATFVIDHIEEVSTGQRIHFKHRSMENSLFIPFFDKASVENAMTCFSVLYAFERWDEEHILAFSTLKPVGNRLSIEKGKKDNIVLNDSYSYDVESMSIALEVIMRQAPNLPVFPIITQMEQMGSFRLQHEQQVFDVLNRSGVVELIYLGTLPEGLNTNIRVRSFDSVVQLMESSILDSLEKQAILIKGSRKFQLEFVAERLKQSLHKTVLEINLDAVKYNFNYYRKMVSPKTEIMVMVKAFGYGSGTYEVAKTLESLGVECFGVAYIDEGIAIREAGGKLPIMVMNTDASALDSLTKYELEPVIYSTENLQEYIQQLDGKPLTIHLEIDTGMHRLGFGGYEVLQALKSLPLTNILVGSIFSHFSASEDENMDEFTRKQGKEFFELAQEIEKTLGYTVRKHIANTAGILRFPEYHGDRVRLGLGIYGLEPAGKENNKLKPITALYAAISQIHRVKAGEGIGYGQLDKSERDRDIATICIGYADGLSRRYGRGVGSVFVQGHFAPFVGNICMDMAMIDVTGINCKEGDRVEIFGDNLTINEMARRGGTISYEILTSISQRVTRVFVGEH